MSLRVHCDGAQGDMETPMYRRQSEQSEHQLWCDQVTELATVKTENTQVSNWAMNNEMNQQNVPFSIQESFTAFPVEPNLNIPTMEISARNCICQKHGGFNLMFDASAHYWASSSSIFLPEKTLQLNDWQSGWDRQWGNWESCYHTLLQMFRMCVKLSWACYPYWPESHSVNSSGTIFVLFKFSIFTFLDWSISLEMHLTDRPSSSLLSFSCIYLTLEQVKILQHIIYQRQLLEVSSLVLIRLSPKDFSL